MFQELRHKATAVKNGDQGQAQFVRFVLNGIFAAAVHYVVYYILQLTIDPTVSYAIGYVVSFFINFYTTNIFTFRTRPTWKNFVGFSGSHGVNIILHVVLFWCFLQVGIQMGYEHLTRLIAPFIVMGVAMLVQFTILRFVFKK